MNYRTFVYSWTHYLLPLKGDKMNNLKYAADNLMLMRKNFNKLYHLVRNRERNWNNYVLTTTRSGLPGLEIIRDGLSSLLYSKYDPMREAESWIVKMEGTVRDVQHIFVFGFGLGYHLEQIIAKYPDKYIHILEPDIEIMLAAIESRDLSSILGHKNIGIFAIGNDQLTKMLFVNELTSYLTKSFYAAYLPFYVKHFSEAVSNISSLFKAAVIQDRTNYATRSFFKLEWPDNIIRNIEYLLRTKPIFNLKGKLRDYPAIVVGSGPSLDADIEYLRRYQDKAIILSAGTSIQALLSRGIKPHIVVSIDGSEKNYEAFKDQNLSGIPFVYTSYIKHKILENLPSLEDVYHCLIETDTISRYILDVRDQALFHSTSSVTGTVIQLAIYLGVKNIVLTGQDLSYPGNVVYASQVDHFSETEKQRTLDRAKEEVINVAGGTNRTSKAMKNTLENIEALVMIYGNDVSFINTSRIGARIKGTNEVPFSQIDSIVDFHDLSHKQVTEMFRRETISYTSSEREKFKVRLQKTYDELVMLKEGDMKIVLQKLDVLKSKLAQRDEKATENCLIQINASWQNILNSFAFAPVYELVIQSHISIYKRYLPEILREQNMLRRGELVLEHLGALLVAIQEQTPQIIGLMERVLKKIK